MPAAWQWWWCRNCDVKWQSAESVCWSCEHDVNAKTSTSPYITSQYSFVAVSTMEELA